MQEPLRPSSKSRTDTFVCRGNRTIDVTLAELPDKPGVEGYGVKIRIDGRSIDASSIDPYMRDLSAWGSYISIGDCPDRGSPIFFGEISYWKNNGVGASYTDRVFVRFEATPAKVSATLVENLPPLQR